MNGVTTPRSSVGKGPKRRAKRDANPCQTFFGGAGQSPAGPSVVLGCGVPRRAGVVPGLLPAGGPVSLSGCGRDPWQAIPRAATCRAHQGRQCLSVLYSVGVFHES